MGYLPGTPGERIGDLRTKKGLSKGQLARLIGVSDSTLSRIESGQIEKLSDDIVIKVARVFNVSTDFLLCETDIPDRLSFDIGELGLSAQSARNLYTRRVNPEVVNRLLENPRFALLTTEIFQYFTDENAAAYAAHNQLLRSMSDLVTGIAKADPSVKEAARQTKADIELRRTSVHQFELETITDRFMSILKEIKRDIGSELEASAAATAEVVEKVIAGVTKGGEADIREATAGDFVNGIMGAVDLTEVDPDKLTEFRAGLQSLFEELPRGEACRDLEEGASPRRDEGRGTGD